MKLTYNYFARFSTFLLGGVLLLIGSCEGPIGPEGPLQTGDLLGKVETFDEFGEPFQDHSGVEVSIEGTDPLITTVTDKEGNYLVTGLNTGTYNLIFTKSGHQTKKLFSLRFIGGEVTTFVQASIRLSQISSTVINDLKVSITKKNNPDPTKYDMVEVIHNISPPSTQQRPRQLTVFLSPNKDISVKNYEHKLSLGTTSDTDVIRIDKLPPGATYYAIMYPIPALCSPYYDPSTDAFDYSCYGTPSKVVAFQVP